MIKYGSHIIRGMLLAPIEQIGIKPSNIKAIFKTYLHEKSYPSLITSIVETNKGTQLVECYFCQGGHDVSYTYPYFSIKDEAISIRGIYHTCNKCQVIAKINEKNEVEIIKRIDYIIKQIRLVGEGFYLGKRSGRKIYSDALNRKHGYAKLPWIWELTYLKRRNMSTTSIIESSPDIECPASNCYPPLLFSGFSSVKEFYESKIEST